MNQTEILNKQQHNLFIKGTSTASSCLPSLQYGLMAMKSSIYLKNQRNIKSTLLKSPRRISVENVESVKKSADKMDSVFVESSIESNCFKSEAIKNTSKMARPKSYNLGSISTQSNFPAPSSNGKPLDECPALPNGTLLTTTKCKVKKKRKSAKRKVKSADSTLKIKTKKRNNHLNLTKLPSGKLTSAKNLRTFLPKSSELLPTEITNKLMNPDSPERFSLPPPLTSSRGRSDKNLIRKHKLSKLDNCIFIQDTNNILPTRIQLIHKFGNENLLIKHQEDERQRKLALKYQRKINEMQNIELKKQLQRAQIYALNELMTRFENLQFEEQSCVKV